MASIVARKRADGSTAYTAQIRFKQDGAVVYSEAKTFSKKSVAKAWAAEREAALRRDPDCATRARHRSVTVGQLIERYRVEREAIQPLGRSKSHHLRLLLGLRLAALPALALTPMQIIEHVRQRRQAGTGPATVNNDLIWLRVVFRYARTALGVPVRLAVIDDASAVCKSERLIGASQPRHRRPTADELTRLDTYFARRDGRAAIPMQDIVAFALVSARRQDEITRLRWDTLNAEDLTVLVPDVKHPSQKLGNHRHAKLTRAAWEIIQRQPRVDERIFPYNSKSVGAAFTRACKLLGIIDLHFHDLRREAVSRLFERGYSVQEVQLFSLHDSWSSLAIYTRLAPGAIQER